jgi:hypothetical protein
MKKKDTTDKEILSQPKNSKNKKELLEEIKEISLEYKLHELPSSQHKAGLAGLYLIIDWLDKQDINKELIKKTELTETGLKVTLTKKDVKDLFDEIYKPTLIDIESKSEPLGVEFTTFERREKTTFYYYEIESKSLKKDKDTKKEIQPIREIVKEIPDNKSGKLKNIKFYIYEEKLQEKKEIDDEEIDPIREEEVEDVITYYAYKKDYPLGSFLYAFDKSTDNVWVKIWREMQWLLRGFKQQEPFKSRLENKDFSKDANDFWEVLIKDNPMNDLSKVLFLSAQNNNAENVDFKETTKNKLLLHFWIFVAQPYAYWTQRKDKNKYKTDEHGFIIAIPDYNKSSSIKVRNSYFEKLVKSEGNATGTYSGNHFKGDLYLFSPQQSNLVKENYFTNCLFGLDKNNRLSDAICNRWTNDIAVDASATELPQSWGTLSIPSGNKWEGSLRPQMYSQGISITNYHKSGNNNHIFNYNLPFKGAGSDGEVNCQYLPPPSGFGNGGTTGVGEDGQPLIPEVPVDWTSLNNQYVQIITSISNLEANLANTSGQQLLALQDDIENLRVTAGQLINEAIQHLVEDGDQSLAVLWFSRAGNISNVYQAILSAIYNSQWSTAIASSVILNEDSPEVAEDKSNFIAAINYLNNLAVNETPIDNLNESQLNSLIDLCDNSFGDYTAILRTFLNIQYGIIITSPEALIQRSRKEGSIIVAEKPFEIVISPNPNNGRFTLIKSSQMQVSELSITDLNGSKVYSSNRIMDFIELPSIIGQGVYILKYKFIGDTKEYSKKLILIK